MRNVSEWVGWHPSNYANREPARLRCVLVALQDKLFIAVCLLVFLPITFGLGLTTAFQGIISAWDEHGGIFQCARPPSSGH